MVLLSGHSMWKCFKALYEGMLVELPLAGFFMSKLLSRYRGDVNIDHLASLDPDMYK